MVKDISVIIPNHNCIQFLPKAIDSALQQADVSLEIIVVDDGSTDSSREWLEKTEAKFNIVKVLKQKHRGVIAARNAAIQQATGEFIAFLDADDNWYPNKLKPQLDYMRENPDCGLTFTNYQHIDMENNIIIDCFTYWSEFKPYRHPRTASYHTLSDAANALLITNVIGTSSVMVRKQVIQDVGAFDPTLKSASDWDCWLRIALVSKIAFTERMTMDYMMRAGSVTAQKRNRINAMETITKKFGTLDIITKNTKRKAQARLLEAYGEMYQAQHNYKEASRCALNAFKKFPNKRYLKHLFFCLKHRAIAQLTLSKQ